MISHATWTILMAISVGALLAAHRVKSRTGIWIAKPLASTVFVAAAFQCGALESAYGKAVLLALILGWLGDVLLIPKSRGAFLGGVISFLFGHLAFIAAFIVRGADLAAAAVTAVLLLGPALVVWRWILPHIEPKMRRPVGAYVLMLVSMVASASGTAWHRPSATILLAAIAFFFSDISVARERFVRSGFSNKLWGLPLYYGAQLVFAFTVADS